MGMNISPPRSKINLISLFDGIGGSRYALGKLGFDIVTYHSYEIDKYAIGVLNKHYYSDPVINLGDVKGFNLNQLRLDLSYPVVLTAGSPCQGFSLMGKKLNLSDPRSQLLFTAVEILKQVKPDYWFLENVRIGKEVLETIQQETNLPKPFILDSADFSPQRRVRMYWSNLPKPIPFRKDTRNVGDCLVSPPVYVQDQYPGVSFDREKMSIELPGVNRRQSRVYHTWQKCPTVIASGRAAGRVKVLERGGNKLRFLTPEDIELAMGYDKGYTKGLSNTQRYKVLGNSFQIDTIKEILRGINNVR